MEKKEEEISTIAGKITVDDDTEMEELIRNLPQERSWEGGRLCLYNNFWIWVRLLPKRLNFQKYFKARDTDIIIPTLPKSGTTWLLALTYSIVNRKNYSINQTPLLTTNPHILVPSQDFQFYDKNNNHQDLANIVENINFVPRVFATHAPYSHLANSILESKCKLIYICRNPLDHFMSYVPFIFENNLENCGELPLTFDECFDTFCRGIYPFGPFWEHVLEYWNAYLKNPDKLMFLTYEDLKEDTVSNVKKIAEFIGLGFSEEEEEQGVIQDIVKLCSFENIKNLEVNKTGIGKANGIEIKYSTFFRKGQVGDWVNHLTPDMVERVQKITEAKLQGSGLKFKYSAKNI